MINCPECGQPANGEAKFCDRCGQGLRPASAAASAPLLAPLEPATKLDGRFEIVELIFRNAHENRYHAVWERDGKVEQFQLRERLGPKESACEPGEAANHEEEYPNGPRAKTADLNSGSVGPPTAAPSSVDSPPAAQGESESHPDIADAKASQTPSEPNPPIESVPGAPIELGQAGQAEPAEQSAQTSPLLLTEAIAEDAEAGAPPAAGEAPNGGAAVAPSVAPGLDLGEVFGRVLALSMTLNHRAFERALEGFAQDGRVYLVYPDERLTPLSRRPGGVRMPEHEALGVAIQVCQAISFLSRRGLRLNDICPDAVAYAHDGRIKLTGLDYISNDTELQSEPIFNDGYTAPEIYQGKRVDKRADIFSAGALLYTCLTGERLECESWLGEAGQIRFYPPHVVSPTVEQAVRRALVFDPAKRWPTIDVFKEELTRLNVVTRVRSGVLTDVGMVREHNEDSVMAVEYVRDSQIEPAQSFLYVVADGMGGAEAGETASAIAVASIRNYVESRLSSEQRGDLRELLTAALEEANREILEYQVAHPQARGMGSTAVGTLIIPPELAVAWVGDSRAYLCDGGALRQVTKDHSLVQRLVDIGQITPEEARHHEHKNVITRSLGARQSGAAGAEAVALRLKRGDRLMLCSDGLTAHVDDRTIGEVLRRHDDPLEASRELVVAANAGGGTDNVSVIVIFAD
jgi:serine/threonine protein phosphatase PrpC